MMAHFRQSIGFDNPQQRIVMAAQAATHCKHQLGHSIEKSAVP
jgi:hypothetical protein